MVKIHFSEHAQYDRQDRIVRIATSIGFGEVVHIFRRKNQYGYTRHCITSTGVVVIKDDKQETVITMFACTEKQLLGYYNNRKPPNAVYKAVMRNSKKKYLFE